MQFKTLFDLTLGRLVLPPRDSTPPGTTEGETWIDRALGRLRFRSVISTVPTIQTVLSDLDKGSPNGVAPLGADGLIPDAFIPGGSGGSASVLVGTISMWAGDPRAIPSGWLPCDGAEVPRTATYQALYDVIRDKFGRASTASAFKLPNFNGRTPMGAVAGSQADGGGVHKVVIRNRGSGYTPGTYVATFTGGVVSTAAQGSLLVGADGKIVKVDITAPGSYSNIGTPPISGESNCAILIGFSVGAGVDFAYDIYTAPAAVVTEQWGVKMTHRGEGYSATPTVTVSPTTSGATAVAVMDGASVREVIITNPGTEDPATYTFAFTGGTPTTPATAVPTFWTSPVVVGDTAGSQQHAQLRYEVGSHWHINNDGGGGGSYSGFEQAGTGGNRWQRNYIRPNNERIVNDAASGNSSEVIPVQSMPNTPPYVGVLFLIKY